MTSYTPWLVLRLACHMQFQRVHSVWNTHRFFKKYIKKKPQYNEWLTLRKLMHVKNFNRRHCAYNIFPHFLRIYNVPARIGNSQIKKIRHACLRCHVNVKNNGCWFPPFVHLLIRLFSRFSNMSWFENHSDKSFWIAEVIDITVLPSMLILFIKLIIS